jgi:hypothetical protein
VRSILAELSRRARSFVSIHGYRVRAGMDQRTREHWVRHGIPAAVIERMVAFEDRWGGWLLPPSPRYDGGPKWFQTDVPESTAVGEWWFSAGDQRCSVPYGFMIGPNDEFGIHGDHWAPLHASIEGWVESIALAYAARRWAPTVVTIRGEAVDDVDLTGMEEIAEVAGMADTWWRGDDTVTAIYRGEAVAFDSPRFQIAIVYAGISELPIFLDF